MAAKDPPQELGINLQVKPDILLTRAAANNTLRLYIQVLGLDGTVCQNLRSLETQNNQESVLLQLDKNKSSPVNCLQNLGRCAFLPST